MRQLRKAKGLTQPVLAKAVGIDQSTLSDIERGAGFSAEILMRLAEELEATCEFIMRGTVTNSENLRRAQQALRTLTNEERAALFAAISAPPVLDHEVEERIPATRAKPATTGDELIRRAADRLKGSKKAQRKAA